MPLAGLAHLSGADRHHAEQLHPYHIGETAVNFDSDLAVFPISDCYAAREDAQAALDAVASRGPQLKEETNAET